MARELDPKLLWIISVISCRCVAGMGRPSVSEFLAERDFRDAITMYAQATGLIGHKTISEGATSYTTSRVWIAHI
jgi:hypothetical protein